MKTPRFEIFRGKNNEFFFRLKAKNGKIIFNSKGEGYTQKHNAEKCIEVVRAGNWRCLMQKLGRGIWVWTAQAFNGEPIGGNETFKTKRAAENNLRCVRGCAPIAEIVYLTRDI